MLREMVAQFSRPALLFSCGKDSIVLLASRGGPSPPPGSVPAPAHRHRAQLSGGPGLPRRACRAHGIRLIVRRVEDTVRAGRASEESGIGASRNAQQSVTLLDAIRELRFDACAGGARRDEEKSRAKERFFSHRDESGQWDPRNQRPEIWNLFNGRMRPGEHFRIFPCQTGRRRMSGATSSRSGSPCPPCTSATSAMSSSATACFWRTLPAWGGVGGTPAAPAVRFRTVGDMTCTGATSSEAADVQEVLMELVVTRTYERGARADDLRSESAMEDRKRAGYF